MRPAHGIAALTFAACLLPAPLRAQAKPGAPACRVEGVWELVSTTYNGQEMPRPGYSQRKVVARGHFMWLGEDAGRDTIPLRTASDSLRAFRVAGGAGTYTLAGNVYTERLEYFYDGRLVGHSVQATCRTEGDRWYHSFTPPTMSTAGSEPSARLEEVWRRIG